MGNSYLAQRNFKIKRFLSMEHGVLSAIRTKIRKLPAIFAGRLMWLELLAGCTGGDKKEKKRFENT
jgi:hypothetical protein